LQCVVITEFEYGWWGAALRGEGRRARRGVSGEGSVRRERKLGRGLTEELRGTGAWAWVEWEWLMGSVLFLYRL